MTRLATLGLVICIALEGLALFTGVYGWPWLVSVLIAFAGFTGVCIVAVLLLLPDETGRARQ